MADIDFVQYAGEDGFFITFSDSPLKVTGNRALVNRFEITFLTSIKLFVDEDGNVVTDNYGGNAAKYVGTPHALYDIQSIAASMTIAVKKTVESMRGDTPDSMPKTEQIDRAELVDIYTQDDRIYATIRIYPVEVENYDDLILNIPIKRV